MAAARLIAKTEKMKRNTKRPSIAVQQYSRLDARTHYATKAADRADIQMAQHLKHFIP